DVEVDGARDGQALVAPDLAQEALARDGAALLADEEREDLPLEVREADLLLLAVELEALEVDLALAELVAGGRGRRRRLLVLLVGALAAEVSAHARDELAHAEGLRDVVVGAELEAEDLVALVRARREEDHRGAVSAAVLGLLLAEAAEDLEPAHA